MTGPPSRSASWGATAKDWLAIGSLFSLLMSVVLTVVLPMAFWVFATLFGDQVFGYLREQVGVNELAAKFDGLQGEVRLLTGEDRVLLTRPLGSAVDSPVSRAEPILTATYVVRRTLAGAACRITKATPMFEGVRNIRRVGVFRTPLTDVGTDWQAIEIMVDVPVELASGRAWVWLDVEYECPEGPRRDETEALMFMFTE